MRRDIRTIGVHELDELNESTGDHARASQPRSVASRTGVADFEAIWLPALAMSLVSVGVFVSLALLRLDHPFELEWMEGGSLQHLRRHLAGEPLYPAPSIDFVPFPYPPLYYWAAARLVPWLGDGFESLRVVSLLSALGTGGVICAWVQRETGRWTVGVVAAGLFFATYRASGVYMDVARIDSFFVLLLFTSAFLLRSRDDALGLVTAAGLAFLATWAKQTGLAALAPLMLWCLWRDVSLVGSDVFRWRHSIFFSGISLLAITTATLVQGRGVNAHFLFYILGAQSGHEIRWGMIPALLWGDLVAVLPLAILALAVLFATRRNRLDRSGLLFYSALAVGVGIAYFVPRVKVGGALNNLIPAHALLALFAGIALGPLLDAWEARPRARVLLQLAIVLQFASLAFDPMIALPSEADLERGQRLVRRLRAAEGEVLIPAQGYLAGMAGKRVYAHQMPVDDLSRSGLAEAEELRESFRLALEEQRFEIVIDSTSRFLRSYPNDRALANSYELTGPAFTDDRALVPRSGWQVGPGDVWVRRALPDSRR